MARDLSPARFAHMKKMASRLGKEFPKEIHARCLDIVARLDGFDDWRAAVAAAERYVGVPDIRGDYLRPDTRWNEPAFVKRLVEAMHAEFRLTGQEPIYLGEVVGGDGTPILTGPKHTLLVGSTGYGKTETAMGMVAAQALAFPGSKFFFADGKGSHDWDQMARRLLAPAVATPNGYHGPEAFSELVDRFWLEVRSRMKKLHDNSCSSATEYRRKVGPMPGAWLVIDEFSVFLNDMSFDSNWRTAGTVANRIKRLVAEGAAAGAYFLLLSQRYQVTDVPAIMRSNLDLRIVHKLSATDADFLGLPEATQLPPGQFLVSFNSPYAQKEPGKSRVEMPLLCEPSKLFLNG